MRPRKIKPAIIIYERLGVINMRRRPFHKKDANSPKQQLYRRRNAVMWQAYNTIKAQMPADILQRCKQKGIDMPQRLKVEITRQCLTPNANMTDWVAEADKILFDKFLMPYKRRFSHSPSVAMEPHCALSTAKKSLVSLANNHHQQNSNSFLITRSSKTFVLHCSAIPPSKLRVFA